LANNVMIKTTDCRIQGPTAFSDVEVWDTFLTHDGALAIKLPTFHRAEKELNGIVIDEGKFAWTRFSGDAPCYPVDLSIEFHCRATQAP